MNASALSCPRVLLLTNEAPHTAAAGAIVLHRLFRDYPPEKLLVVTNYLPPPDAGRLACRYVHVPLAMDRLNRTRLWPWRAILRSLGATRWVGLARVDHAVADFAPEIVVTLMQDSWYYELAARFAAARNLPLALFIHDVPSGFEPVPPWLQARQQHRDAAIYRHAQTRLCISPGMESYFQKTFGVAGEVLLPPRSESGPSQAPESCQRLKSPDRLTLGYAGGLHYGYGEQLLRLLPVLRATGTRLELYCARPGGILTALNDATDVLHFNGYAATPEQAWRGLLEKCDAVLQPYLNPPGEHEAQYRTHFPSKLGDCLALGLPLLITGPADASGMAWCLAHPGCTLPVTDPAPDAFATAISRLRTDAALRIALSRAAQQAALAFDAPALRAQLMTRLFGLGNTKK